MSDGTPDSLRTSRPKAGENEARLEHQLAVAQQITHIGSWQWDVASNVVTWSDELYRIYGLEPQSCVISFETFLAKLHPEDRLRVQGQVGQALERGGRFSYPERIVRPDGTMRELDTVGEALLDSSGKVAGLIGTCRDVTEERKRDEAIRLYASIAENVQIGLTVWRVDDATDPTSAVLVAFNPAAELAAGEALAASVGKSVAEIFPAASKELPEVLGQVAGEGLVRELPSVRFMSSNRGRRIFSAKAFPLPGSVGLALEDVTVQTRARQLTAAEQRILEMIASGAPLEDVLRALVLAIEEQAPGTLGSILLLDQEGMRVRHAAAPHLPDEYTRAIDGLPIGPFAGSCGTAAYTGKQVLVSDIATDPLWSSYRDLALPHGLRACWSTPILSSEQRTLGTFALYYREPRGPEAEELELIARATHLGGIAIQRKQLDDQLRELSAHIEAVREDERTAMAREIHDELGQALTALKMDVAWIGRRLKEAAEPSRQAVIDKLPAMSQMTDDIIDHVRRISAELRPGVLDDLGLVAAIEWQAQEFERRTNTVCAIRSNVRETRFERSISTPIFRIFQEALTNVARHAEAGRVDVSLEHEHGTLRLEVRDDGRGIGPDAISSTTSLGLLGIRERTRRMGGNVTVTGQPGKGTLVTVEVPLAAPGDSR